MAMPAATSATLAGPPTHVGLPAAFEPIASAPRNTSANMPTLSATSSAGSRARPLAVRIEGGNARRPSANTTTPIGRFTAKSHGHEATDKISAANDGPATDAVATVNEL